MLIKKQIIIFLIALWLVSPISYAVAQEIGERNTFINIEDLEIDQVQENIIFGKARIDSDLSGWDLSRYFLAYALLERKSGENEGQKGGIADMGVEPFSSFKLSQDQKFNFSYQTSENINSGNYYFTVKIMTDNGVMVSNTVSAIVNLKGKDKFLTSNPDTWSVSVKDESFSVHNFNFLPGTPLEFKFVLNNPTTNIIEGTLKGAIYDNWILNEKFLDFPEEKVLIKPQESQEFTFLVNSPEKSFLYSTSFQVFDDSDQAVSGFVWKVWSVVESAKLQALENRLNELKKESESKVLNSRKISFGLLFSAIIIMIVFIIKYLLLKFRRV